MLTDRRSLPGRAPHAVRPQLSCGHPIGAVDPPAGELLIVRGNHLLLSGVGDIRDVMKSDLNTHDRSRSSWILNKIIWTDERRRITS